MGKRRRKCVYAVARGRNPGIYSSWEKCSEQVNGFPGNQYKGFDTVAEAECYMSAFSMSRGADVDRDEVGKTEVKSCYKRFTSLSELCALILDNWEPAKDADAEASNGSSYFFFRDTKPEGEEISSADYYEYDEVNDLLHFQSKDHLFAYLGMQTIRTRNGAVSPRYFNKFYTLEFVGISRGYVGKAGAGIVLWMPDDILVCKAMMGIGNIPMELANLHAFITGMKLSLTRGIQHLRVIGNFDAINQDHVSLKEKPFDLVEAANELMKKFKYLIVCQVGMLPMMSKNFVVEPSSTEKAFAASSVVQTLYLVDA
ncbi:hypothetical protein QJS10_CPB18g01554 [Acorus calamus]|uniref:Ribonuclease H n=1 Tax=Acorus calamus TaxID=4465 RepID=A0AAV9CNY7_ACOCL|nr:hypothetical protein QJS10_CPB18g01554 [Acorus calamus]